MPRINALTVEATPSGSQAGLAGVKQKLGSVPNIFRTFAHSPAVLNFYLAQSEALAQGELDPQLREQIAVAVAGVNQCDYCASAHTLIGKGTGLSEVELAANLRGRASDSQRQTALNFARQIVEQRGVVSDQALAAVRGAGFSEAEIVEIIAHVGMNLFTNYFNHIADTEVDFPRVDSRAA